MALRKIETRTNPANQVKTEVFFNPEFSEYLVKVYRQGNYQSGADYFTDDRQDARDTAQAIRGE